MTGAAKKKFQNLFFLGKSIETDLKQNVGVQSFSAVLWFLYILL